VAGGSLATQIRRRRRRLPEAERGRRRREGGGHTCWAWGRARSNGGGDRRRSGGELGGGSDENGQPDGVDLKLRGASDLENFRGWTRPFICAAFLQAVGIDHRL